MSLYRKSYRYYVETIAAIEQSLNVNSVKYDEIIVWPYIRSILWAQLNHPDQNFTQRDNDQPIKNEIPVLSVPEDVIEKLNQYKNTDILLLSTRHEYREKIRGKYFSPHLDSLIDFLKNRFKILKFELATAMLPQTLPRFEPVFFSTIPPPIYKIDKVTSITNFDNLKQVVFDISGIVIDELLFIEGIRFIKGMHYFFLDILKLINPKAVFFVCYYNNVSVLSLILACKRLGIKTIDIQHGVCGNYHASYTHWTSIPSEGYNLIPDYFWCWGESFKNSIEKWYTKDFKHHKPITVGNIYVSKWKNNDDYILNDNMKQFYKKLKQQKKVVLITMQNHDKPMPEYFFETLKKSPSDWMWLFRLHPKYNHINNQTEEYITYKNCLYNKIKENCSNFEIDNATNFPLYGLLKRCDHHITISSASCYEALAFMVPSTILDISFELLNEDIKKGVFTYAKNSDEILASIDKGFKNSEHFNPSEYIVTDEYYIENTLRKILDPSLKSFSDIKQEKHQKAIAYNELGKTFLKNSYNKAAINTFLKAIDIDPNFALSFNNLGVYCWNNGKKDNAFELLKKAYEIAPYDKIIIINIINILQFYGKNNEVKNICILYLEKRPDDKDISKILKETMKL